MKRGKRKKFCLKNIRRFLCFCFPFGKKKADAYQIETDSDDLEAQFCSSQTWADNLEICVDDAVCAISQNELSPENEMSIQAGDEDWSPRQWLPKRKVRSIADISPEALLALIIPGLCDILPSWDQYMYQREDAPDFIFMNPSNNSSTVSCVHYYPTSLVYYGMCMWRLYLQWQAYTQIGASAGCDACRVVALSNRTVLRNFLMVACKLSHIREVSKVFINYQYTIETFVTSVPAHPALFKAIFGHLYYRKVGYSYGVPVVVVQNIGMKRFDMKHGYPGQRPFGGQFVPYLRPTKASIGLSLSLQLMSYRGTVQNTTRPVTLPRWKVVMYRDLQPSTANVVRLQNKEICKVLNRYVNIKPEHPGQRLFGGEHVQYSRPTKASIDPSPSLQLMPYRGTVENPTRPLPLGPPIRKLVLYSDIQPVGIVHLQKTMTRSSIGTIHPQLMGHFMSLKDHLRTITTRSIVLLEQLHVNASTNILSSREYLLNGIWTIPTFTILSVSRRILASSLTNHALMDSMNNVNQNIMENDDDSNDDQDEHDDDDDDDNDDDDDDDNDDGDDGDDDEDDDDDDDVHEDLNSDSNVDNIKSQTSSANVNVTVIDNNELMVKIDASTKVNDIGYNTGASDHVISYVESFDNMSPDDTAPLVKTHPKAILHASSDPPPLQDQHKSTDLLTDSMNNVNQNIIENDVDGNEDENDNGDGDDDVHEDLNSDSNVDNIKSQTSSANANITVIGDNDVMVKIAARTKVNDVGYNPGASDHVISYVESLDNVSPDDTAPLAKTHPKAILHASSDPPPQQDQHKRTDLLTVAENSIDSRTDDTCLTVSNPFMFALFEQPGFSLDAAPLFILHTKMTTHNGRERTKLLDTAICICALAFSTTISPRRWDMELLNLIVEDAAGVEATILQHTKKEDCSMDQLPQNVNITFESLHSGPQSLRLGIKQIISGSLTSLGSAPSEDCLRTTHRDLNDLLTALKLALKLHSSIGAVMWCAGTVYAVMRVRYNKVAQYKEDRVVLVTITQTDLIMEIFERLSGCVTFITSLFASPETFRLLPIYKCTSSLHHVMRYFKMSK